MTTKETAIFGGGCFWCTEAVFLNVKGVTEVASGYSGGNAPGVPTYREICSGLTGHAEVIELTFDPSIISYSELLLIFMTTHDPTTLNRQGADVGTQYRSVIFYQSQVQKETALAVIKELQPYFQDEIVTDVSEATKFHKADKEHQDYYNLNKGNGYCTFVIDPKLAKLKKLFRDKLK
ncbi:MAG: peptide-methionine (S)-S-oxide reductase [Bacteroidetes bacterium MedPE-SWsnd-G2]|nr:MAG: peptide-methionine (S)-S-oxide reductase [Bacteroidetes bacterium MedPE-SWsnd-G2]